MRVCDICKTRNASYNSHVVINDDGEAKEVELCPLCYREHRYRSDRAKHQAYEETVKAMTGETPRKSHWWDMFSW